MIYENGNYYGARHYDPCIMRFTTMDPMCEKYYHLSPYAYCGNNPVNAVDIKGDSLTLIGERESIKQTINLYNEGLGGFYNVEIDANGLVSISPVMGKDPSKMSKEQSIFYKVLSSAVQGKGMATINVVNNSENVIIANADNKMIDIGDIDALGVGPYINKYSVIAHETSEAYNYQAKNNSLFRSHFKACGIERLMTGSYIDPLERNIIYNGKTLIPIRSDDGSKIVHKINIITINGNIKKVSR